MAFSRMASALVSPRRTMSSLPEMTKDAAASLAGTEGRLERRIDLRTDIDTRDRIDRAVKKLPARKRRHVMLVEFGEPPFGERRGGP